MVKHFNLVFALVAAVMLSGSAFCAEHDDHKAPHGGALLEVGEEVAHVELVHDEKAGKVTLYILDKHAKKEVSIKDAPKLNIKSKDGNKQIETKGVDAKDGAASKYEATDETLKADPLKGRVAVVIEGKNYNVDIKEAHEHK